jgi:MYXO-CTERM domain-containing protein
MNKAIALSVLAVASIAGVASAQITNGSFETGDFTGWSQFGDTSFTGISAGGIDGVNYAAFGPINGVGGISQIIAANVGDQLTVGFWLYNDGFTPNSFSADFDGATLMSYTDGGFSDWTHYSFNVTIANANPTLSFSFYDNPAWIRLDGVTVTPAPGAAAALGLAGLGAARRRRR